MSYLLWLFGSRYVAIGFLLFSLGSTSDGERYALLVWDWPSGIWIGWALVLVCQIFDVNNPSEDYVLGNENGFPR